MEQKPQNSAEQGTEYTFKGLRRSVFDHESLRQSLVQRLDLPEIDQVIVERESLDARRADNLTYLYNLRFTVTQETGRLRELLRQREIGVYATRSLPVPEPRLSLSPEPIVIGTGPAGLFAGLWLARMGYRPILFERGQPVAPRARAIERLWNQGILDPESNMQFGEGGAGTFSDGKLTTGKSSPLDDAILRTFVGAGAPERILMTNKPHIGTDYLRRVIVTLTQEIVSLGGEVHFGQCLTGIDLSDGAVSGIRVSGQYIPTDHVILAIGHSARDTLSMLDSLGVAMEPKPLAIGTRIEHPAAFINETQYGPEGAAVLPPADYRLTYRQGRQSAYSFCMCPGGQVVCASSEPEGQVTNGMSRFARDGDYSNSALVVAIDPKRQRWENALDAVAFQRELESSAFEYGGGGYYAPAQNAEDFLRATRSSTLPETTYRPGVRPARIDELLPRFVADTLKGALKRFERIMPGFVEKGVLIGLESRTSSPVRLLRDELCQSLSTPGLYVLGEGSGYAGGIMTCARDAVRFARMVMPRDANDAK